MDRFQLGTQIRVRMKKLKRACELVGSVPLVMVSIVPNTPAHRVHVSSALPVTADVVERILVAALEVVRQGPSVSVDIGPAPDDDNPGNN